MPSTFMGVASFLLAAISLALWFRSIRRVAIPENRTPYLATWILAAGLGVVALFGEPGWIGGITAGLGAAISIMFLFTVSISRQKLSPGAIDVGATIPHFTATDEHGQHFDSASLAGHPVLIKFFRGHW